MCDVASIHREFDYVVPDRLIERSGLPLEVGLMVRVPLHGRQVAAWVVDLDVESPPDVELRAVSKVSGVGPPADIVELCRWSARRWAGRVPTFLGTASPPSMVTSLPRPAAPAPADVGERVGRRVGSLFDAPVSIMRLPPAASPMEVIRAAAIRGRVLVVCPTFAMARSMGEGMRRVGIPTAVHPDGWARAAAGCSLVGTRTAVFAPMRDLGSIVVLDEHDETLQNEGSPTWNARDVAVERGRAAGVPVVLVSPTPSLEALAHTGGKLTTIDRARERAGWARLEIIDRRDDDLARSGLYSEALVRALRTDGRVVCVLNRTGRAQMLGCHRCGTLATCERCEASVRQDDEATLVCPRCATQRPVICMNCSSTVFRPIRIGVTKAREQLETLLREPVDEVAGPKAATAAPRRARVVVGTEAVLQRVSDAGGRRVPRVRPGTRRSPLPSRRAGDDPPRSGLATGRRSRRSRCSCRRVNPITRCCGPPCSVIQRELRRPSSNGAPTSNCRPSPRLQPSAARPRRRSSRRSSPLLADHPEVLLDQRDDGRWLVRSPGRSVLLDALSAVQRPPGRLQLQVDPARLPG